MRRWKNAPLTTTAVVSISSSTPDPQGEPTVPQTWSAQVIAMKDASIT